MTKEELVTLGLTEEQAAKVVDDYGKNYVAKSQFNARNEELKLAKAKVAELTSALAAAKEEPQTELAALQQQVTKLTKQIEAAETAKKEAEAREQQAEIRRQTVEALTAGNCTNPTEIAKIVAQSVKREEDGTFVYTAEDGSVSGVKEGVSAWLKANAWAVADVQRPGSGTGSGAKGAAGVTAAEFAKMGYRERAELFAEQPELYQELATSKGE